MINIAQFLNSEQDLRDLYFAYKQNPENYNQIRQKVAAVELKTSWKLGQKRRNIFVFSVAIIAALTSVIAVFYQDWFTIGAIWAIWLITALMFGAISLLSYRVSYKTLLANFAFFEKVELLADTAISDDDFCNLWKQSQQKNLQPQS